jgi:OmpA-OmpF porin, OOP family
MNQQLSMERAQAVIAYLIQDCKVPVRHIIAPGAIGTADPATSNETASGRAENRRVEVNVLVKKVWLDSKRVSTSRSYKAKSKNA